MRLVDYEKMSRNELKNIGIVAPTFDRKNVIQNTTKFPTWLHFGASNIFRAFLAPLAQTLVEDGESDTGIIVVESYDHEIIDVVNRPYDNLSLAITLKANGKIEKNVIASITESLKGGYEYPEDLKRLSYIVTNPSLQMISFTITEKGYRIKDYQGEYEKSIKEEFDGGPNQANSILGIVTKLLYDRYLAGGHPIALVSMDNCSHNGDKLYEAVVAYAHQWHIRGFAEEQFVDYVKERSKVTYPITMIDKITPRPDESIKAMLASAGFEDVDILVTKKHTYVSPFVNAEETQYLVVEEDFPNGRPKLERAGVIFTDRAHVDLVEKMKVCTCLNPLHTALAIFGCLFGYRKIYEEMEDGDLLQLVHGIGENEGMKVVTNPQILNPKEFLKTVLEVRLPNPFMPDTPQRIVTDTSQKLSIRFGETIKAYVENKDLNVCDLVLIPVVFAAWLRYLMGVDDFGAKYTVSPDPLYDKLKQQLSSLTIGYEGDLHAVVKDILSDPALFGVNLYQVGLGGMVEIYLKHMLTNYGAVRETLKEALNKKG